MSRKEITVTSTFGRDDGKQFLIREMDAFSCEEWAREALSSVYRCASQSDQGILSLMSEGIREAFTAPVVPPIVLPSDGSMTADHPVIRQAQKEAQDEASAEKESALNAAPTQMAALIGMRLFFQLPFEEQRIALRPLLKCCSFPILGRVLPVTHNVAGGIEITKEAREYIEEPQTIAFLQGEAFKLHTDFFTPAVRSICDRMMAASRAIGQKPATSPEP
ncbi:hypothetical protein [Novacetimonas pomaceti]|uniref:hypothetical protein n=1 Tax=Novacetimonas pomaceti TaxID=2021998 RepID=UPI001C2D1AAC|nr:hypothetical protein [Novacetimonas pomaceti]MBV1833079.1 hypothetical protein [Novacetimonas pomaceti]